MKTLDELKTAWREAKHRESTANADRLAIEELIVAQMPTKLEGTVSQDGITITYKLTRKCDTAKLQDDWMQLPESVQAAFKWSASVDTKSLRALDSESTTAAQIYFTSTPAKPSIQLKD